MKKILPLILFLLSSSCLAQYDNPLLGKWVLDKESTLNYSRSNELLTPLKEKLWKNSKTIITFTNKTISTNYGSDIAHSNYSIIETNEAKVTIKYNNSEKTTTFYLTSNGFYLTVDEADREYYIKHE